MTAATGNVQGDHNNVGESALKSSPLDSRHRELGARMSDFGGWSMPIQYTGIVEEHTAVRERVGVFDVSHLGKALVRGAGAREFVNTCLSNDLARIGPGQAQYTLCCAESGGVVDDLIAYLRSDDEVFLIPNAANTAEVVRMLTAAAPDGIEVINQHDDFAVLAVQGPYSDEVLSALGLPTGHDYMQFRDVTWAPGKADSAEGDTGAAGDIETASDIEMVGVAVTVCRTGYTGERGYELVVSAEGAGQLWDAVIAAGAAYGIAVCGLGARDTLRTEMGYPLHGQDLTLDITPVQARSGWAVGWSKPAFWGREALVAEKAAGPRRVLRGVRALDRGIPRPAMEVRLEGDAESGSDATVGVLTSGTFSPTLKVGIGLALLDPSVTDGAEVVVDVRGRPSRFVVTKPPFVTPSTREP